MAEPERAFTRRKPNANPIALELDRLAEQKALATLGRGGPAALPRSEDRTATDAPMATEAEIARELADNAMLETQMRAEEPADSMPTPEQRANEVRQAIARFNYDPDDPQWGGLDEDVAHQFWADRLAATAHRYPDMDAVERAAFQEAFKERGWALPKFPGRERRARR